MSLVSTNVERTSLVRESTLQPQLRFRDLLRHPIDTATLVKARRHDEGQEAIESKASDLAYLVRHPLNTFREIRGPTKAELRQMIVESERREIMLLVMVFELRTELEATERKLLEMQEANAVLEKTVAELRMRIAELEFKVQKDGLTGLYNKLSLLENLPRSIALYLRAEQLDHEKYSNVALIIFDLNDFKLINDTLGHLTGDEVLKKVAQILEDALRDTDMAFRIGGDEFAALLVNPKKGEPEKAAKRILSILAANGVRIAYGVADIEELSTTGETPETLSLKLYKLADERMYLNKNEMKQESQS